jgi:GTP cyclohydrolase I
MNREINHEKIAQLVSEILTEIGEDPNREGLVQTPLRVARSLEFLTSGYRADPEATVNRAIFIQETHNMVIARDIELYSLCEHHLLPFFGRCHIGYIAEGRVIGVSKLARLVDVYSRRLQIQERLTDQIAHSIMTALKADGVGVTIEAQHLCMMMRGVEKQNSMMTTSAMLGSFRQSVATRTEFLTLIGRHRP